MIYDRFKMIPNLLINNLFPLRRIIFQCNPTTHAQYMWYIQQSAVAVVPESAIYIYYPFKMFVADNLVGDLACFVVALLVIFVGYYKWQFQYWERRKVPYLKPRIPFGNHTDALRDKEHMGVSLKRLYNEMKNRGWRYGGTFTFAKPGFLVIDLDLVRNVLTKDFQYFTDRNFYHNEKDPLEANLLTLTGARWRSLRAKLSPTFTSGKIKMMFNIMAECQNGLEKRIDLECLKHKPIDIKEVLACFTTNIIGSCAFGLDFNALEDENSEFRIIGRKMFRLSRLQRWKRVFAVTFPQIARSINLSLARKDLVSFIMNVVEKTINYREKNNYRRNDFMQILIDLKNNKDPNDENSGLTLDEIASQVNIFFGAGFETSSTLMTFALYELSKNQDIQDKLRHEINSVLTKHNNQFTYDAVQDMAYLSQVIDETLRMHPPGAYATRICVKDYKLPNEDVVIEKGRYVTIPILGIHYDEEYYPNPTEFDPDRFSEKNKKNRHNYAHLPFGEGPRNCIAMRFGLMQAKVGMLGLLRKYKFTVDKKTTEPLVYSPKTLVLSVEGGVWLNTQKL